MGYLDAPQAQGEMRRKANNYNLIVCAVIEREFEDIKHLNIKFL
tara:strand:- start:13425 stop:13556 length:132 start_codon:yes stop_codon:yes gene_type:complete